MTSTTRLLSISLESGVESFKRKITARVKVVDPRRDNGSYNKEREDRLFVSGGGALVPGFH